MTTARLPTPLPAIPPDLVHRFGVILAGLAALIARRFLREPRFVALIVPLWTRLNGAARRFERLMARLADGRPPKPHRSGSHRGGRAPVRLPQGHAWLVRALGYEAAAYTSLLDHLLAEPGVAELLAATPAAGRILRPLGRMLGLRPLPQAARPHPGATEPELNDNENGREPDDLPSRSHPEYLRDDRPGHHPASGAQCGNACRAPPTRSRKQRR